MQIITLFVNLFLFHFKKIKVSWVIFALFFFFLDYEFCNKSFQDISISKFKFSFNWILFRFYLSFIFYKLIEIDVKSFYFEYIFRNRLIVNLLQMMIFYKLTIFFLFIPIFIFLIKNFHFNVFYLFYLLLNSYLFVFSNSKIDKIISLIFIAPVSETFGYFDNIFPILTMSFYNFKLTKDYFTKKNI